MEQQNYWWEYPGRGRGTWVNHYKVRKQNVYQLHPHFEQICNVNSTLPLIPNVPSVSRWCHELLHSLNIWTKMESSIMHLPCRHHVRHRALQTLASGGTVNQQILAAIKFGVSQNIVIYVNLAAIKFGVSPRPVYVVYDRRICWRRQILVKTRNSPNSPNIHSTTSFFDLQ